MCLNPKWIYKKGFYQEDNYRGKKGQFYELGTYSKCGCCEQCMNEKSNNWAIRNHYESKGHERKCFITLTYEHSPYILVRKDMQDFMKRLRINLDRSTGEKVRFFGAGEYGTLKGRPHFHILIYGWNDENGKYIGMSKKGNLLYQSELIQESWGLGRTTYQKFVDEEIAYTALYATPKEQFSRAYKLNLPQIRELKTKLESHTLPMAQRNNLYQELDEARKILETEKKKFYMVKEFNAWSQGLGWEEYKKEYDKNPKKCFEEYIGENTFTTPSPWVKRLANAGDKEAAKEMFRREEMIQQSISEAAERNKNILELGKRKKTNIIEWDDEKTKISENL